MIQQIEIQNQSTNFLGNFVQTRNTLNSLKQNALSYKIVSNWYINLSYITRLYKSTCKPYKDWFSEFSWDL